MSSRREFLASVVKDTLNTVKVGKYKNTKNKEIFIKEDVDFSVKNTILYSPEDGDKLVEKQQSNVVENKYQTKFEVTKETTLKAISRLLDEGYDNVSALNFASARHPGGGFINGSSAQEESLARSSSLYESLSTKKEMYDYNNKHKSGLYSDYMIYSPNVVVFKDDFGDILDLSYKCSFITSPAVNLNNIQSEERKQIRNVMTKRIEKILAVSLENGHDTIVLGAFGCGVFKNRPADVTQIFGQVLNSSKFKNQFKKVVFAVYDKERNTPTFNVFKNAFGKK